MTAVEEQTPVSTARSFERFFGIPPATRAEFPGICPVCANGQLRVVATKQEPLMGELGPRIDTVACDNPRCGCRRTRIHGN